MAFMASSNECSSVWLLSFARRKLGDDIEAKSCSSFELDARPRFSVYAAMLLMIARRAG